MKIDNYNEIMSATKSIQDAITIITKNLNDLLSSRRYQFDIRYNRKDYNLYPPTTEEEKVEIDSHRNELIQKLIKNTINRNIKDNNYGWHDLLSFCGGHDAQAFEITQAQKAEYMPELDKDGKRITHKPLDTNNIHYINQRSDISEQERQKLIVELLSKDMVDSLGKEDPSSAWWLLNNKWWTDDNEKNDKKLKRNKKTKVVDKQ